MIFISLIFKTKQKGESMPNNEESKKEYFSLLEKILARQGVKALSDYLIKNGFFTAPASTKYHLCVEGGLLAHTLHVANLALELKKTLAPDAPEDSVILCALFHDCHKATDGFSNPTYLKNDMPRDMQNQPYIWNKEQLSFSGAQKSLLIVSGFVSLRQDEMQAIAYHDGPFVPSWEDINGNVYPLTFLVHFADLWSSWVVEKGRSKLKFDKLFLQDK
jgi:hypothetical protein